ncbi:MAG: 4-alpha-glucanotransferase [Pseudomonadota bacterium]
MTALWTLSDAVGIERGYFDIYGNHHAVSEDTCRRLLGCMGFDVDDDDAVARSLDAHSLRNWRRALPPVAVLPEEQRDHAIDLVAPSDAPDTVVHWRIEQEDSLRQRGELRLAQLAVGERCTVDGAALARYRLPLPAYLPQGYHDLRVTQIGQDTTAAACRLIVAPATCHPVSDHPLGKRHFGFAAQLYALQSARNWGMGDFSDLIELAQAAARQGATTLGLNPLHATYTGHAHHISPYSPSNRGFLNLSYIDVTAVPDFDACVAAQDTVASPAFQAQLASARATEHIEYHAVWALKHRVLTQLFAHFVDHDLAVDSPRAQAFSAFCDERGQALAHQALFDALFDHFYRDDPNRCGWQSWPAGFETPEAPGSQGFARDRADAVQFQCYLHWVAEEQLREATNVCSRVGLSMGLYLDLAVGCDAGGAEVWADRAAFTAGVSVGAPPDQLSPAGQSWGLTPLNPVTLVERAYEPFVRALRENAHLAGTLRIDHVLGLMRQFWVLDGEPATAGCYVRQPLEDLLRLVALESRRARCVIVGEALGTVPEGFEARLDDAGLLAYRVLYFERWPSGLFKRPDAYPGRALVTASTHDLPTVAGWWQGREIDWMAATGLFPGADDAERARAQRQADRHRLLDALIDAGTLPHDHSIDPDDPVATPQLLCAVQGYLTASTGSLMVIPLEDLLGMTEQVNLPGTIDQHPNWRQRLPCAIDALFDTPLASAMGKRLRMGTG